MILSTLTETLVSGLSLGLLTGTTCFATCGPIYTPFLMQKKLNLFQSVFMILEISAGRFVSYILFGIAAGMLGKSIGSFGEHKAVFTSIAYVAFSVMLIMSAFNTRQNEKGCAISKWGKFANAPFLLGVVTGINFCPSFLIALTNAVSLNGPLSGAVLFFGFYLGTNVYLLPLSVFGVMGNQKLFRKIAMVASIIVGSYFIYKAGDSIYHIINTKKVQSPRTPVMKVLDGTPLYILKAEKDDVDYLVSALSSNRSGTVSVTSDKNSISDSCYVLVTPGYDSLVVNEARGLLKSNRFIIVLPENDSLGYSAQYSVNVVKYLDKYYFKKDTIHGTFFNMSKIKEKKIKPITYDTTQNDLGKNDGVNNE